MLELPPTLRFPRKNELPKNSEAFELLEKTKTANIVEGFTFLENDSRDLPFEFYAEININNSRIWKLFTAFANLLPADVSCVYNLFEEEAIYSQYLEKEFILAELERHQKEFSQDCNLEFGLVFDSDELFEEIFVSETKYLKFWGNNEVAFRNLMSEFNLQEIQNLNFVDEFPKVIKPLSKFDKNIKSSEEVIEQLNIAFAEENK
jgi:hypothetical protein